MSGRLLAACGEVIAVLGNNDVAAQWPAHQHDQLADLGERARIELPGGTLAVRHGPRVHPVAARHGKLRSRHPDCRAIVYGHSHQLLVDQDAAPWVLNPGAAGRARTNGGPSCLLLDAGIRQWRLKPLRFLPQ